MIRAVCPVRKSSSLLYLASPSLPSPYFSPHILFDARHITMFYPLPPFPLPTNPTFYLIFTALFRLIWTLLLLGLLLWMLFLVSRPLWCFCCALRKSETLSYFPC